MKTKVFLSGGMKSSDWQKKVINEINSNDFIFYNPREHNLNNPEQYTAWDLFYVKECDILFAFMSSDNPSGFGLTLEVGYAKGLDKLIILIDEKSTIDDKFASNFKIVRESSTLIFENLKEGIEFLKNIRNGVSML